MTFAIENSFALAILGEHNPDTSTTKDLIYRTDLAFWRVSTRILEDNTSLPSDKADVFEGIFTLSMLGERVTSGVDANTLVASATQVYLSIRGRLIRGECILSSAQSTMGTSRPDPSVIVLFGLKSAFAATESDVGEYPDNIINGEYEEYDEDDVEVGLPNSGRAKKGKRVREGFDPSSPLAPTTKRVRKDRSEGIRLLTSSESKGKTGLAHLCHLLIFIQASLLGDFAVYFGSALDGVKMNASTARCRITMSFNLELNLALAIRMEQMSTGTTNEGIRRATENALRNIQQRFENGNYTLPRATRTFERQLIMAILMEQETRNLGLNALIIRTTTAWGRISARLNQGRTPFPEPYHVIAADGDEDISIQERLRRMGLDPKSFDLTGFTSRLLDDPADSNKDGTAQPHADMNTAIRTSGIISGQATVFVPVVAAPAAVVGQSGKVTASGKPRNRKRGKDMYGCNVCNQAKKYTSACTLYRHKKKKHGIPTPGDLCKERQRALQERQASQAAADPDSSNGSDGANEAGDEDEEMEDGFEDEETQARRHQFHASLHLLNFKTMSYELEYSLALAIDNEQASGASQEAVLNNGSISLTNIRRSFDVSNFEIPRATRLLERLFTLAILREQAKGNIDIPSLITRAVAVLAPPAMPAVALKATAPARRRYDRKRSKDRYGSNVDGTAQEEASRVPTPDDLRKERKLAAEAALAAQAEGDIDDSAEEAEVEAMNEDIDEEGNME
ncbi:hypothetical protein CSAL01_05939 [Colletotrichum salicis]|uniref:Uncharacterized protein n=1 Tax=Colletotrichum salicis TaxID=1209931 RepID=A0A135U0I1_9PEZI|nr:hypothetical protein CSAL01_05939 [Colletotrichum salicis]